MEFLGDQGRDVVIVRDFLKNINLFFIGPQTSIGNMYLGPYYYYLFVAPGLLLTNFNPVGPSIVVALLSVLTTFLIYYFSKSWFNQKTALLAAYIYAISPVIIKYSNFSWNPNIMPLFALLFIYFLTKSKPIQATLAFIIALNSHYLALILLPIGFVIWLFKKTSFKSILISILIFIISLTPQILFDIKHNGQNLNALKTFFTQRETTVNLKAYKALPQLGPLFVQINTRLLASKDVQLGVVISIIFIVLIIANIYSQIKTKKYNFFFLVFTVWYFLGLVGLALYKQHIYDHYFAFLFPAVIILFSYILSILPKTFLFISILALTIYAVIQNPFRWQPANQLSTTTQIVKSIILESENNPFNFALLAKMNYDQGYKYVFYEENAKLEQLSDHITDQLFVVCEPFQIDCNPINNPEWSIAAFGWAKIDKQWEINGIKIFKLSHNISGLKIEN